jgi:hypothetical protein
MIHSVKVISRHEINICPGAANMGFGDCARVLLLQWPLPAVASSSSTPCEVEHNTAKSMRILGCLSVCLMARF